MRIFIVSPWVETGGVEALHQLCNEINRSAQQVGATSAFISYQPLRTIIPQHLGVMDPYHSYPFVARTSIEDFDDMDHEGSAVILPEGWWPYAARFKHAKVAIWHLGRSALADPRFLASLDTLRKFTHLACGDAIFEECRSLLLSPLLLEDYMGKPFSEDSGDLAGPYRKGFVTNLRGFETAQHIVGERYRVRTYSGLKRWEVRDLLMGSRVWLEIGLGSAFGLDRGPQEAALQRCVVIAHRTKTLNGTTPPLPVYDTPESYRDAALNALDNYEECYLAQAPYRAWITEKPQRFRAQTLTLLEALASS